MVKVVTFLALLSRLSSGLEVNRACVPNTQFVANGRVCHCNNLGWWSEASCLTVTRRANCLPGQVVWQGCSQCICQETGQLLCSNTACYDDSYGSTTPSNSLETKNSSNSLCTPFKSYYINCSLCVCPASGKTSEAHCATDSSCQKLPPSSTDFLLSVNKNICIPNVMYLFPCLHCLCSDGGYFVLDKCVETCHRVQQTESARRCLSRTFYRKNCNVCWCPDNNIPDDKLCTQSHCNKNSKFRSLDALKNSQIKCTPYSFLKRKCFYCNCNTKGFIHESACLELDCLKLNDFKYDATKTTCSPGEMVPACVECFCLRNGMTNKSYCSSDCSYQSKLNVLERVLKDSSTNRDLLNRDDIKRTSDDEQCTPNSMYLDQGRYCLCPENGNTNFKLCTSVIDDVATKKPGKGVLNNVHKVLNQTCKPNTFVEIDCNTCYCGKNGKIDPKWCTYDDCRAKKIIQDTHKTRTAIIPTLKNSCVPGSISKVGCNFCICPENGMMKDQACTKNKCTEVQNDIDDDKFTCEPLDYYLVDCNVCLCPRDGVKNVAKCTKKICEKTFLRSDSCIPGQFFSNDCNVCVCPPNGDKEDKVCTNHSCPESETPWKKIFKLSQSFNENSVSRERKRELDVCFSGEEFEIGCKICVCTDVGLRSYATCTESRCEEQNRVNSSLTIPDPLTDFNDGGEEGLVRPRRAESCMTFNLTAGPAKDCTPGAMYIVRCRQCICPYVGNINMFCRPMPQDMYCEQAFPYFNYQSMGRRTDEKNGTSSNTTSPSPLPHRHTSHSCSRPGRIVDECFVCECEDSLSLHEEHCFRSDAAGCRRRRPTFLEPANRHMLN